MVDLYVISPICLHGVDSDNFILFLYGRETGTHAPKVRHRGQNLQGIILESKRKTVTGDGGNYIIRSFIIGSVHQILLGSPV